MVEIILQQIYVSNQYVYVSNHIVHLKLLQYVCVCVSVCAHTHARMHAHMCSPVPLFTTPLTVAHHAPLSMGSNPRLLHLLH